MLVLTSVVLATPLVAAASAAVSPPMGVLAALLAPFQPQEEKSGLHPRQVIVPPECFQVCNAFLDAINVGTLTSLIAGDTLNCGDWIHRTVSPRRARARLKT